HDALGGSAREGGVPQRLTVHTVASLAHAWLLPRLAGLRQQAGGLRVTLQLGYAFESLPPSEPAVAIRLGGGNASRSGLRSWLLWRERMLAVASPAWIADFGRDPAAWPAEQRLRHIGQDWPRRLGSARLPDAAGIASNDAMLLAHAALLGEGVAWIRESIVRPWLESGALVALAEQGPELTDHSVWLVCREEMAAHPAVRVFCQWAQEEAAKRLSRR
ncbi:MAG TPA: LysR substrate-binding domain-containing protein, partial [Burkholderiaceae bacterium]|nr:LysR substrate-binding domain-containing protein [Burkholderiaceae bacterium]